MLCVYYVVVRVFRSVLCWRVLLCVPRVVRFEVVCVDVCVVALLRVELMICDVIRVGLICVALRFRLIWFVL